MLAPLEIFCAAEFATFRSMLLKYANSDPADPKNSSIWKDIENLSGRCAQFKEHANTELVYPGLELPARA